MCAKSWISAYKLETFAKNYHTVKPMLALPLNIATPVT